jgi:hypothetical protein
MEPLQVCQASAKLVPGPQYLGRIVRAHSKHTSAFGAGMFGDFLQVMVSEGANRTWDYPYS